MLAIKIIVSKTVKQFAEEQHVSTQSVYSKMKRMKKELKGHIWRSAGKVVLDDKAQELLMPAKENQPLAKKVGDLQSELDKANGEILKLRTEVTRLTEERAERDETINQKNAELEKAESEIRTLRNVRNDKDSEICFLKSRIEELTDEALCIKEYKYNADAFFTALADSKNSGILKKLSGFIPRETAKKGESE